MSMQDKEILIIDDAADIRLLARKVLEGDGARVSDTADVDTGLEFARTTTPHLILLDLEMPGKSGFDFLVARREIPELLKIPIVILSGKTDKSSVVQAVALGAADYVLKPFRAPLLLQKIRKALELASFLSRKFVETERPKASFSIAAEVVKFSEGGCQIEASVKLGAEEEVSLSGELLRRLGVQDMRMRVVGHHGLLSGPGRYLNEVAFVGMDEQGAKRIRVLLKDLK